MLEELLARSEIRRLKEHTSFDQLPDLGTTPDALDIDLMNKLFAAVHKTCTKSTCPCGESA